MLVNQRVLNATVKPEIFYGLHMCAGLAEYQQVEGAHRILIDEQTIKNMDSTFPGRPVYVHHVDEVKFEDIQKADGYVVESFFNKADGKHWAKFIVVSDRGHEAIRSGWKLSNAYLIKNTVGGGRWHGLDYDKEVTSGEYEHLAIVPNPRYDESIILTPDQFKEYNQQKEAELIRLKNSIESKEKTMSKFTFWKKEKVENGADLDTMSVILPKSGKAVELSKLINDADEAEEKKDEAKMANGEDKVKVGEEEMTVNSLLEKYNSMCAKKNEDEEKAKNEAEAEELKKKNEEEEAEKLKKENEDEEAEKLKKENEDEVENEDPEEMDEKKQNAFFEKLKNAADNVTTTKVVETAQDQVARGKSRYGSSK